MENTAKNGKVISFGAKTRAWVRNHALTLFWIICALAMLRVFLFSAVFPFFNNVDEQSHFDTVVKYSKGYLPRENSNNFERESAELIVLYGSPEYFSSTENFKITKIQPFYERVDNWVKMKNHEAFSPPVYYALAGTWYNLGKLVGLKGGALLYWIRFLNVLIYAALFWFSYLICKKVWENDLFMQFGLLLLLAFFPQDVFYSINNDVLSPLFCLISFYLLFKIYNSDKSPLFHFLAGIMVSATFLVKYSNLPILVIFAILIAFKTIKLLKAGKLKEHLPSFLFLLSGCFLPIICWLGWNAYALGDIMGNAEKIRQLGWTVKSFVDMWDHPLFTFKGLTFFVSEIIKSFWQGEFVWGMHPMTSTWTNLFYVISSSVFVLLSVINTIVSKDGYSTDHRSLNYISALMLFFFFLFLAVYSIMYDFGTCFYPSREQPFFTSGRLILGGLVPFLILYIDGLRIFLSTISKRVNLLLIFVLFICIFITYSEIKMTYPVLKSSYNWFHTY